MIKKCKNCNVEFDCDPKTVYSRLNCYDCVPKCRKFPVKICVECGKEFNGIKFCSRSCSVSFHNRISHKRINPVRICTDCNIEYRSTAKYCWRCQENHKKERIDISKLKTNSSVSRRLISIRGRKCENCLNHEWFGFPINLELHHIDGDNKNNNEGNVKLLCPNCHSNTENWRGRNKK